jgi:5-methylcytosine-specific restriction protein B
MPLERYALGQPDHPDTYSRWIEFGTPNVASMKGGSASKHLIFKRLKKAGWYFDSSFATVEDAWQAVRAGFVELFKKAESGDWDTIDDIPALQAGMASRTKTLYVYFPEQFIAVTSNAHIKHFLLRVKPEAFVSSFGVVRLNRVLLHAMRELPGTNDWSNWELACFLYSWADPRDSRRIVKIAPGEDAKYWDDCLREGYICVGWDKVGDLTEFESKETFKTRFEEEFSERYNKAKLTQKTNEVWTLRELEAGDIVVANKGTSQVIGVGKVVDPGYEFRSDRPEYSHTVKVEWDTSLACDIPPQKRWAFVTVAKVPLELYEKITRRGPVDPPPIVDALYREIAAALERKGQLILYGPPGTGKTYTALRFSVWWLLEQLGRKDAAAVLADRRRLKEAESALSTVQVSQRVWWVVTNPKEWSWDRLKKERTVEFGYGRLRRNFLLMQPGDLVIGYQSTPDKRIVALTKVSRGLEKKGEDQASIQLSYLHSVENGLTYDELLADGVLAASEPMRFRNQGTLFTLNADEAGHALSLLAERDPDVAQFIQDQGRVGPLTRLTFHASYSYEDFIEGFRPADSGAAGLSLRLEDGVFKRICREAQANPDGKYLVLVDEINRANVAKVFGELITLLEMDKRGVIVTLPQSKESFTIPDNVFVLGTMNTADRSIRLLDSAMRRRFAFVELMPDAELLSGAHVEGLDLGELLLALNRRIAEHVGREKQIGHSFLMENGEPISDPEEFARRFRQEILPLLQEYCYDDYGTLGRYLGDKLVDVEGQTLREDILADVDGLLEALSGEFVKSPGAEG